MEEHDIKELLLKESDAFRKVYEEHKACEKELEKFHAKGFLTETEKLAEKEIKKTKLVLKDRMYVMIAERRKSL